MAAAPGPYVALLNSDTRVHPGWLAALVRAAEERTAAERVAGTWDAAVDAALSAQGVEG